MQEPKGATVERESSRSDACPHYHYDKPLSSYASDVLLCSTTSKHTCRVEIA